MKKLVLMLAVAFSMTMFSCGKADNAATEEAPAAEEVEVVEVATPAEEVAAPAEEAVVAEGEAVEAPAETPAEAPAETPAN